MPGTDAAPEIYELYTDGACSGNPGPGGWAFILRRRGSDEDLEESGGESRTTNNRMEMLAVIRGLEAIPAPAVVELFADSEYVVKGLTTWLNDWKRRGWRTASKSPVKNQELWEELDRLRAVHDIRPQHVRGHVGHPENTRCDQLAVQAARAAAKSVR